MSWNRKVKRLGCMGAAGGRQNDGGGFFSGIKDLIR